MKRMLFAFLLLLSVLFIFEGCNSTPKDFSNILKITEADEITIQEYLDAKTNDISAPYQGGKIYSAFEILGADNNKIYVWMLKSEYLRQTNELTNGVSVPIVLYIETKGDKIKNHSDWGQTEIKKGFEESYSNAINDLKSKFNLKYINS